MIITRKIKQIFSGILASLILICLLPAAVVRADASLGMSVSGNTEVGSTITVSVSVDGGPYANFDGGFSYDSAVLELKSITSGNYSAQNFKASGSNFVEYGANFSGAVIVVATFSCKTAGSATVSCSLGALGDMSGNDVPVSGVSKSITVTAPAVKSSNADLKSLAVSPGSLSPEFSAAVQSYSATVEANQSKITVSAAPADGKAKVSLNGVQSNLVSGKNTVKVTVTAENGATKVYTISVTRSAGPTPTPTPTPVPLPLMNYNGKSYTILTAGSSDTIPDGFTTPSTAKYQNVNIPVLQKTLGQADDASVMDIVLLTADGKTSFFVYDPAAESCYPYQMLTTAAVNFQILDKSAAAAVPSGYEVFDYTYNGSTVTAYRLISDPENPQILMYLMDGSGISAFYYYDTQNQMLMMYRGAVVIAAVPTSEPSPTPSPAAEETAETTAAAIILPAAAAGLTWHSLTDYTNPIVLIIYLIVLFCLVLLVTCIILIFRRSAAYEEEYEEEPEEYQNNFDDEYDTPFVSPQPKTYFNDFGQSPVDNELFFGDKPPAEPVKLDFPSITQHTDAKQVSVPPVLLAKPAANPGKPVLPSQQAGKPIAPAPAPVQPQMPIQPVQRAIPNPQVQTAQQPLTNPQVQTAPQPSPLQQSVFVQQGKPGKPEEHVPVRLKQELEAEKAQKSAEQAPRHIPAPGIQTPAQPSFVQRQTGDPVRRTTIEQPRRPKPNTNDPDYDPDDE